MSRAELEARRVEESITAQSARNSLAKDILAYMAHEKANWTATVSSESPQTCHPTQPAPCLTVLGALVATAASAAMNCALSRLIVAACSSTYLGAVTHDVRQRMQRAWFRMCDRVGLAVPADVSDSLLCNGLVDCWLGATEAPKGGHAHQEAPPGSNGSPPARQPGVGGGTTMSGPVARGQQGLLVSALDVHLWTHVCGLPHHVAAAASATICLFSSRWPLLVDPDGTGLEWLQRLHRYHRAAVAIREAVADVTTAHEAGTPKASHKRPLSTDGKVDEVPQLSQTRTLPREAVDLLTAPSRAEHARSRPRPTAWRQGTAAYV